jgi:adenine-specific DNA-methyltransferase
MPTLDWIGKKAVLNHHHQVPYHLLKDVPDLSVGDPGTGNLIVEGDNLLALKALLPYYAGQVKCIYIDPPYNTGNEGWVYNDNTNSPLIRNWLGKTVGKEAEDLSRHDKWLCMMYPRLTLLREFLRQDGAIFVSIDDNELANLLALMRDVFGGANEVATIVWEKGKKGDSKLVSVTHEYIVAFARDKTLLKQLGIRWRRRKPGIDDVLAHYQELREAHGNDHAEIRTRMMAWYRSLKADDPRKSHKHYNWSDARGLYFAADFAGPDDGRENRPRYAIKHPITGHDCAIPSTGWRWEEETTRRALAEDPPRIHFGRDHTTIPNRKSYLVEIDEEPMLSVFYTDGRAATLEVEAILGPGAFQFPKDSEIIADLISMVTRPGDIVLDSFAGSGTTAHAVLKRNRNHSADLKFILIELDETVATRKTRVRVQRAVDGYTPLTGTNRPAVEGLGGGFRYCRLNAPLFDAHGQIREEVSFGDLARHVYFTETGEPLPRERVTNSPKIGVCRDLAVYLLYNGILGDRTVNGGNVLTRAILARLPPHDGPKIIYGAGCKLGLDRLRDEGITFRQTPYEVRVS